MQINQCGAGPLEVMVDGTSGGTNLAAFKLAEVIRDGPGFSFQDLSLSNRQRKGLAKGPSHRLDCGLLALHHNAISGGGTFCGLGEAGGSPSQALGPGAPEGVTPRGPD
jgi:Protein of unknown function (DUF3129).